MLCSSMEHTPLEGRFKIFPERYMEFISGTKQQFLQTNDKLYESMELPTKNIRSSTED